MKPALSDKVGSALKSNVLYQVSSTSNVDGGDRIAQQGFTSSSALPCPLRTPSGPESSSLFNVVVTSQPSTKASFVGQGHESLPAELVDVRCTLSLQISQAEPVQNLVESGGIGVPQAHEDTLSSIIARDEIYRSYVTSPDTSLPILEPDIVSFATRTALKIDSNIDIIAASFVMKTFEATSTLPYGHHSTYKLLDASQIAEASKGRYSTYSLPFASSTVVAAGQSVKDQSIGVSVTNKGGVERYQVVTSAYQAQESVQCVWAVAEHGKYLFGMGGQFEGYKEFEMKLEELLLEKIRRAAALPPAINLRHKSSSVGQSKRYIEKLRTQKNASYCA